jgi:RNA polymerase sigma-70 factor, ECF subfamily
LKSPSSKSASKTPRPPQGDGSWMSGDEDVQLMLRFKAGDKGAFDELVKRNAVKVGTLVHRFLGDPDQVEDLTQEVFMRIYRTAPNYQPSAKFSTWLYRIVANLSFNVLRSRKRGHMRQLASSDPDQDLDFYGELPDPRHIPPHQGLHDSDLSVKVAQAINDLPESQKVAIILNKFEQKNYEDIATVLNVSTVAVKSLLSRARSNLKRALAKYLSIQ